MNLAAINPLDLPSLSLTERKNLPDCAAIYFSIENGFILYIGKSINFVQRWANHNNVE